MILANYHLFLRFPCFSYITYNFSCVFLCIMLIDFRYFID